MNKLEGKWELVGMRVIDGEGFTHYVGNFEGELVLDFESLTSIGEASFHDEDLSGGQAFTNNFSGDSVRLEVDQDLIYIGENTDRHSFSILLSTRKELILEYYDTGNFQMRKFIFTRL